MSSCCSVKPIQPTVSAETFATVHTALLIVWGMGCPNCAMRVRNTLVQLDGVVAAYVDHEVGMAGVRFNPNRVTVQELIDAVGHAGNDGRHKYCARLAALTGSGRLLSGAETSLT